jgi:hypothetical protein
MNNDLSSSSQHGPDIQPRSGDGSVGAHEGPGPNNDAEERQKRHLQQDRKATYLDHLIRNIDIMIYCQLSVLYYME